MQSIVHATTVHPRKDTRIFFKECISIAKNTNYSIALWVRDGRPPEIHSNVKIENLGTAPKNRVDRFISGIASLATKSIVRKPDLIHIHDPELVTLIPLWITVGIDVIFDMHENIPKDISSKHYLSKSQKAIIFVLYRIFERILILSTAVICAENSYAQYYPWLKRKATILNYPRIASIPSKARIQKYTFGYLGSVSHNRGIISATKAIKRLRGTGVPATFLCIGPIDPKVQVAPLFSEAVHEGWLEAPGRIQADKAWPLIAQCRIGLAILDNEDNFTTSYPTKIFEYMAIGIPIIASDFPLYKETVDRAQCGITVSPDSEKEIFDAMRLLATNETIASELGNNGRLSVSSHYSWESEEEKLNSLYEGLISSKLGTIL